MGNLKRIEIMADKNDEPATGKGRFDDDEVWGEADDPMDALANMSDNDILNATKSFESEMRSKTNTTTRVKNEIKQLDARIKENQEKIGMMSKLPYMVATVGELVEPLEEDESAGSGMGSGMNTTSYGKKEEKKEK